MRMAGVLNWLKREKHAAADASAGAGAERPRPTPGQLADAAPEPEHDFAAPHSAWSPMRLEVAESLWGEGATMPGGSDEVLRLAIPFGLTSETSLLMLGGGGGAAALRLATELSVWVQACETDPVLVAAAGRRVQRSPLVLAKRATVQSWDPAAPSFRRNAFNHAVAVESLAGPAPEAVLASLAQAVKPGGQMALLETVATEALDPSDPTVAGWCHLERREPPRAGTRWITEPLTRAGWDLRTEEDISQRQVKQAVGGWRQLVREMRAARPSPRRAAVVVAEAELWLRRVQLLRSGRIQLVRWHLTSRG